MREVAEREKRLRKACRRSKKRGQWKGMGPLRAVTCAVAPGGSTSKESVMCELCECERGRGKVGGEWGVGSEEERAARVVSSGGGRCSNTISLGRRCRDCVLACRRPEMICLLLVACCLLLRVALLRHRPLLISAPSVAAG